jgi:hypothetical protein
MDAFRLERPVAPLDTPRAEIEHLQEAVRESGSEKPPEQVASEVVKQYAAAKPEAVLHPAYALKAPEVAAITLDLAPEPHDSQMEALLGAMQEKGIKNALTIAESLNNPHLLDDFHRFLIQFIAAGYPVADLKEKDPLWKPLHTTLFEVSLPETTEADKTKKLKELISSMEQFYAGMLSISAEAKDPAWFSLEVANANGSSEFVFYVSVPTGRRELFEKQILATFPNARIREHHNDYNIFNDAGVSCASYAKLAKQDLYPLKPYEEFDVDPLNVILNSFSKIDREGEGAAIQLVVSSRQDGYTKSATKAIEKIRQGTKIEAALAEINQSLGGELIKGVASLFKSSEREAKEKEEEAKRAQALDQTAVEQFTRKLRSPLVAINLRVVASAATEAEAAVILHDIESSFNQFENGHGNRLEWKKVEKKKLDKLIKQFAFRTFDHDEQMIFNLEEVTTCLHFPASQQNKGTPQLKQSKAGAAPAPQELLATGTQIGVNNYRGLETKVFIAPEDRMRHFYAIGQTGTGKTTLLKNMIVQDIKQGHGVCFVDPHGSDVQDILANIPPERYEDVVYFDPAATERPMALNMLEYDRRFPEQKTFVVNEMFSIFQKLYGDVPESMGPMFEQYFRNATNLVIEDPDSGSTLLEVSRVMSNKAFRDLKISKCHNPIVVQFWKEIAEKAGGEAALANIVPYITSKFDVFLANDIMRPIIAQEKSSFNLREIMDGRKILLVNLSKGRLGDINSHLIGLILVGKILMAALSRVDSFGQEMPDFYLYLDEFQNITTDSIATILSEARKYRLSLTIAHQFIGQLDESIKNAVFGNVGSLACFRVGSEDAEFLEKQFAPTFTASDIINLDNRNAYVRLLADGRPVKPFNMETLAPEKGDPSRADKLRELSSLKYGRRREEVEAEVMGKYNMGVEANIKK